MKKKHSISVRDLVEFIYRAGNLDNRFNAPDLSERGQLGTKAHKKLQKEYEESFPGKFESEVSLACSFDKGKISLSVYGRADGIHTEDEATTVDEIKTTRIPLKEIDDIIDQKHLKQCMCYAYMVMKKEKLEHVNLRITYFNLDDEKTKHFDLSYSKEHLEDFFNELASEYVEWLKIKDDWVQKRNESINLLKFPFDAFRAGQRKFAVMVYHAIKDQKKLFAQAPTGIGKTLATLFPSIKAMGKELGEPIFYLTSKTITRQTVENTLEILRKKGLKIKSAIITAKEKMCINDQFKCNPINCPFAKGHFDRVNNALKDIVTNCIHYDRDTIQSYSIKHEICPYELALDLSEFADCIICDYNYLFDPQAHLKRYFEKKGDYIFLVDEAHNLPDRAREMYSSSLQMKTLREMVENVRAKNSNIAKSSRKLEVESSYYFLNEDMLTRWTSEKSPEGLKEPLEDTLREIAAYLLTPGYDSLKEKLTEYFFELNTFNNTMDRYDEHYTTIYDSVSETITLYCIDPSLHIKEMLEKGKSCTFFSATLSPIEYYKQLFGASESDYSVMLNSPFNQKRLCLLINSRISTKYKARKYSADMIVRNIELITRHTGNYMIFFPSYKYMEMVYNQFVKRNPTIKTGIQTPYMKEEERESFLELFMHSPEETFVGFVLMGGIFGEGIDLIGSRLSGAIVVGVGLPQIGFDRDIIKDYYQEKLGKGWEYAYVFPGANKVMQAVGRVIRSHEDKGVVILIDQRFVHKPYPRIFPADWSHALSVRSENEALMILDKFWNTP